ncbi:unnamed protein product [Schistosoma mattheei]|uniref:Uncharacterized protein n=1 Tax=Schistosoma mattheei TaxID=31246 RepID=A0A183NE18_9TREM|nr:unnamed protein product [Schistosoma mattheei]
MQFFMILHKFKLILGFGGIESLLTIGRRFLITSGSESAW